MSLTKEDFSKWCKKFPNMLIDCDTEGDNALARWLRMEGFGATKIATDRILIGHESFPTPQWMGILLVANTGRGKIFLHEWALM